MKRYREKNNNLGWYADKVKPEIEKIINSLGFKLVKLLFIKEYGANYLRIKISHVDRLISLNDCELVSRAIEKELDLMDLIPFSYVLEVESPGIDTTNKFSLAREFNLAHEDMEFHVRLSSSNVGGKESV